MPHVVVHTHTHTHTHTHAVGRYSAPSTFVLALHVISNSSCIHILISAASHVFRCIPVGLDKPLHTNHNQMKIYRPSQHFNVSPHSATYFGLREPSLGTYFYILINIDTVQLAILSC